MSPESEPRPEAMAGRIAAWIARQVERGLSESELSLPQYRVLGLLAEGTALPSSMADRLDVRRPSITAVVDGLVARGLVARAPAGADRRQISHSITTSGRQLLAKADLDVNARLAQIAGCLATEEETTAAFSSLELWGKALSNWRAGLPAVAR